MKKTSRRAGKIDFASLRLAFNERALVPNKVYNCTIDVVEADYIPDNVDVTAALPTGTGGFILGKATGAAIEALEQDEKVLHVSFPVPKILHD